MMTAPYFPPEWAPQESIWMAWPSHEDLWDINLLPTQIEVTHLIKAFHNAGTRVNLACLNSSRLQEAQLALAGLNVSFFEIPYGEIWFRDTLPLFLLDPKKNLMKARFQFNGWGEKYLLPGDTEIGDYIAKLSPGKTLNHSWILEGGSIDVDGLGHLLTTEQCLLNPNRNPGMTRFEIEKRLCSDLGVKKVYWIKEGLINDHTDGHIDTIIRFVRDGEVVVMTPTGESDPNFKVLNQMQNELKAMRQINGEPFKIHYVTSPGEVLSRDGEIMPASYMNFVISNESVVVPTYGSVHDSKALHELQAIFPDHKVIGLSARSILEGGGAFHCITQQIPKRIG